MSAEYGKDTPIQKVIPGYPFVLQDIYLNEPLPEEIAETSLVNNITGFSRVEIMGQGIVDIIFYNDLDDILEFANDSIIPSGIESLKLPVSTIVYTGRVSEDEALKAKCILAYKGQAFNLDASYDDTVFEKPGEKRTTDMWFEKRDLLFPPDLNILGNIHFTIDLGK